MCGIPDAKLAPVLDVIGNKLAVSINQAWAGPWAVDQPYLVLVLCIDTRMVRGATGHPGSLVRTLPDPPAPSPKAGSYATGRSTRGLLPSAMPLCIMAEYAVGTSGPCRSGILVMAH